MMRKNLIGGENEKWRAAKHMIFYVQPIVASYRMNVIDTLNRIFELKVFANLGNAESTGFAHVRPACAEFVETNIGRVLSRRIKIQSKIVGRIILERPAAVFIFADVTYLSLWVVLAVGRIFRVPIVAHGQGLYRYQRPGFLRTVCYRTVVWLSARYVCYSNASKRSLLDIGCQNSKLVVASNSLRVDYTVTPSEKSGAENGILFIGRLREGTGIEMLVEAVDELRKEGVSIILHLVGAGEYRDLLEEKYGNRAHLIWHGKVFDEKKIAEISRKCRIGCYPGAAGLSVVHMFGLSLPPLVHDRLSSHNGPEPEYVVPDSTGFLYSRDGGVGALAAKLRYIWSLSPEEMKVISRGAFEKYQQLNNPSLGERFADVIEEAINQ